MAMLCYLLKLRNGCTEFTVFVPEALALQGLGSGELLRVKVGEVSSSYLSDCV